MVATQNKVSPSASNGATVRWFSSDSQAALPPKMSRNHKPCESLRMCTSRAATLEKTAFQVLETRWDDLINVARSEGERGDSQSVVMICSVISRESSVDMVCSTVVILVYSSA